MADQKPADDKQPEKKPEPPKPLNADVEKDLRAEIAILKSKLAEAEAQNKALEGLLDEQEKARAAAKAKKGDGPKIPRAKMQILGEGRRVIAKGAALRSTELDGLVLGEHYELADD